MLQTFMANIEGRPPYFLEIWEFENLHRTIDYRFFTYINKCQLNSQIATQYKDSKQILTYIRKVYLYMQAQGTEQPLPPASKVRIFYNIKAIAISIII